MEFTPTTKAYNALIGYINELVDRGYDIDARHNGTEGYGFYIWKNQEEYINIFIFNAYDHFEYFISLTKNNSRFKYDIINDIEQERVKVETELDDDFLDKIKEAVERMLKKQVYQSTQTCYNIYVSEWRNQL